MKKRHKFKELKEEAKHNYYERTTEGKKKISGE